MLSSHSEAKHNIAILPKQGCYGCGVCVDVCPSHCIRLQDDAEGFPYPNVDQEACIDCQICIECCPGLNDVSRARYLAEPVFYAGYHLDETVRYNSSSGGIFSLAADQILAKGGVVYGARYDFASMQVEHARVTRHADLVQLRKSKYVQSSSVGIFPQVRQDLQSQRPVLFSGTPCQVAGLHLFLNATYDNLVTCDNICHGVPSPGLFQRHFAAIQAQRSAAITHIDFRTKARGWKGPLELFLQIDFDGESTLTYAALDAYYALFLANLTLRPCCYHCKYATKQRQSDLTLGDYWGVSKHHPELFDGKGTSVVLANTEQGQKLLQAVGTAARLDHISTLKPLPPNLVRPTQRPKYRDTFFKRVDIGDWHPKRRWQHLVALVIIAGGKARGILARLTGRQAGAEGRH